MFKVVSYEKSIIILRVSEFLKECFFLLPVLVLFFKYKGVSAEDYFMVMGFYSLGVFLFEIPTGYLGDICSRKKILFLGIVSCLIMNLIWYFQDGFIWLVIAVLFDGLASALLSGTREAYLYDVLKKLNRTKDYQKELGKNSFYVISAIALSSLFGGFLYSNLGPDTTVLIEIFLVFLGAILILFLPDLEEKRIVEKGKSKLKDIADICKHSVKNTEIKWIMFFPAVLGVGSSVLFWSSQSIMETLHIPIAFFGIGMFINQMSQAILSRYSYIFFKHLKIKKYTLSIYAMILVSFILSYMMFLVSNEYILYLLIVIFLIFVGANASLKIIRSSMINDRVKSNERSTVLSVASMFAKGMSAMFLIFMKFFVSWLGLQNALLILGLIILVPAFYSMKKLLRLNI